jgi:thioredoxin-like negative regulator of GroEL
MLFALSDAAWRVVVLLALGVAPYAAPVGAAGARTRTEALLRLAVFLVLAAAGTGVVRAAGRTRPRLALAVAVGLLALPVTSLVVAGERGPLARGAWIAAPLVWSAVAVALGGLTGPRSRAHALAALAAVVGVGSLVVAAPRLRARDLLWARAFAESPGDESAARVVAAQARARGDVRGALTAWSACHDARPAGCECAAGVAESALDLGRYAEARAALDATPACTRDARRLGGVQGARVGAPTRALDATEPHGAYARAWGRYLKGDVAGARPAADEAVKLGRGVPARLLQGLLLYGAGDLDRAAAEFQAVLAADPTNVQATYDAALVAQKRNQYREAREGYLRVLRLDPTMSDARYNLVVLTHDLGATMEAAHHADAFAAAYPQDPRIATLRRIVAAPPPREALTIGN